MSGGAGNLARRKCQQAPEDAGLWLSREILAASRNPKAWSTRGLKSVFPVRVHGASRNNVRTEGQDNQRKDVRSRSHSRSLRRHLEVKEQIQVNKD